MRLKIGDVTADVVLTEIRNIHLSVYPPTGRVRISAPLHMSLDTIRVFAIAKLGWIRKQQARLWAQKREAPHEYVDRESHYLWGRRYLLKVVEADRTPSAARKSASCTRPHHADCSGRPARGRPGSRRGTVALPFCCFALKAKKHLPYRQHARLWSIAYHLRKRRFELGLLQQEVGQRIGTTECCVYLWERGKANPTFPYWPKIIEFLGYSPYDPDWTPSERLTWIRRYLGLSQEAMARRIRVDPGTLAKWERGEREPKAEHLRRMSSVHRNA